MCTRHWSCRYSQRTALEVTAEVPLKLESRNRVADGARVEDRLSAAAASRRGEGGADGVGGAGGRGRQHQAVTLLSAAGAVADDAGSDGSPRVVDRVGQALQRIVRGIDVTAVEVLPMLSVKVPWLTWLVELSKPCEAMAPAAAGC